MPDLALTERETGRTTRLKPHGPQLPDAGAVASAVRVKELEAELVARNAHIRQLEQTIGDNEKAILRARDDIAAIERKATTLGSRLDKMQRQYDELRHDKSRSDAAIAGLQAVIEERARLIERLERTASVRDELLSQLQREVMERAAWACRTVEMLMWSQLRSATEQPSPVVRVPDSPALPAPPSLERGLQDGAELDLLRRALELEQRERHRLESIVQRDYVHLKRRVIEAVERLAPRRATVVIVSKGDDDLLKLNRRRAWHFPQTEEAVYAGHYPASSAAAITHLEQLRGKGAQFLVFPATSRWWLDHYAEFESHLARRYRRVLDRDDVGVIFDIRRSRVVPPDWKADLTTWLDEFQRNFRRNPAILDCGTDLEIAASFPQQMVFSPPAGSDLPYLDSSIDVVVCSAGSPQLREARRVARVALLTVTAGSGRSGHAAGVMRLDAKWLVPRRQKQATEVSIVIPCHNGAKVTRACLEALDATLPASFAGEVIVVDDASTDGTQTMLARWAKRTSHARVLRNATNSGFIASCNRAARAARGEMLVFLNNDTQPSAGWLTALLRTFDDHPDAGAVGGKLVFPNGTLQEAGSLVFRDGSAANFGRGHGNPDHPLFSHVRPVDYCSAALLATPRHIFLELHGFDSSYVPAYYEDTDYCFRLREKGYSVYYQPSARVVHHEGASCGTDLARGVKRYQAENQKKFHNRWKRVLEHHPERPDAEDLETWQRLSIRTFDRTVTR